MRSSTRPRSGDRSHPTGHGLLSGGENRIVASTEIGTRENLRSTVHMMEGRTAYARFGDWPGWVSLVVTLFTLIRRRRVDTDATS